MSTNEDAATITSVATIDRRIARALRMLASNAVTSGDIIDAGDCCRVAHELESPREAAQPAEAPNDGVVTMSDLCRKARGVARTLSYNDPVQGPAKHLLREFAHRLDRGGESEPAAPQGEQAFYGIPLAPWQWSPDDDVPRKATRHTDAEIREAVRGRTTPDGRVVRWVAWSAYPAAKGFAFTSLANDAPRFDENNGLVYGIEENVPELNDPARAGTTLFVGEGADPREQAAPTPAPDALPPLVGPKYCGTRLYWMRSPDSRCDIGSHDAAVEWERIARAERAAREAERAQRDEVWANALRMQSAKDDAERERDAAQETAARLAVERNDLRAKLNLVVRVSSGGLMGTCDGVTDDTEAVQRAMDGSK